MRLYLFLFVIFISFAAMLSDLNAGQAFQHCKEARSTADSMTCVKQKHDEAQKRLNDIFQKILKNQNENNVENFNATQNDWISYRDKECSWEMGQLENEALKRIEMLSCLTALTEQRSAILEKTLEQRQETEIKEYGSFPRWMNVVAHENPDFFWQYGSHLSVDLDCDGQSEEIMLGRKIQINNKNKRVEDPNSYIIKTAIAITENPVSGKPQTKLLQLNKSPEQESAPVCGPNAKFSVTDYPEALKIQPEEEAVSDAVEEAPVQCEKAINIKRDACDDLFLFWNGDNYELSSLPKN